MIIIIIITTIIDYGHYKRTGKTDGLDTSDKMVPPVMLVGL